MQRPCLGPPGQPCPTGEVTPYRRCPSCKSAYESARPSRRAKGRYDHRWVRLRKVAIKRQPWCSVCHTDTDLTADHIVPLANGGRSVLANMDVLCRAHNSAKRDRQPAG